LSGFDTLLGKHVDKFSSSLLLIHEDDDHRHQEVIVDLLDEVELLNFLLESDSGLLNTLQSEVLRSYGERDNLTNVVLNSFHDLVGIGGGVAAVLRKNIVLLENLLFQEIEALQVAILN